DQVDVIGKIPDPWWFQWESRAEFFNEDAAVDIMTGAPFQDSLEDRYDWFVVNATRRRSDMGEQGEDEKKAFLHMISMMLQYLPSDRATIQDVVESEWQKWGIPLEQEIK
ncbi:hypothetical protein ACJ73_05683, partial [Blastomyces percursus]